MSEVMCVKPMDNGCFGTPVFVRPMKNEDIERVFEIESSCFADPWSRDSIVGEMENALSEGCVLIADRRICGFYFAWHIFEESSLLNIAVDPEYRGLGYGRMLFEDFLSSADEHGAEELFLEVNVNNVPAISLYESEGFKIAYRRKNYYQATGDDAFVMKKGGFDVPSGN